MSTIDVAARLRAANPLPRAPALAPPADVLAAIVATPRQAARRRRPALHRPLLAAGIAVLLAAGLAIGATVSIRYFDEPASHALPAPVRRALASAAAHRFPTGPLAFDQSISAYRFSSSTASGRVYMTPYAHRNGFCAALAVTGRPVVAGCADTVLQRTATTIAGGLQPWGLSLTPDVHALLGRLQPGAIGDTVRLEFEDGTRETLPRHGRWFAYAVAGTRTAAGHRPVALELLDGHRLVRRLALDPLSFNTLAAAHGLVPASDGSRGENAVRRVLLGEIGSKYGGDGGQVASQTRLSETRTIASIGYPGGLRISVFATPVGLIPGWHSGGGILLALSNRSSRPISVQIGANGARGSYFRSVAGCACGTSPSHSFFILYGDVPRKVTRVAIRASDGTVQRAAIVGTGAEWAWAARATAGVRPVELIGRDATGRIVVTRKLHGRSGTEIVPR